MEELLESICYQHEAELMLGAYASEVAFDIFSGLCTEAAQDDRFELLTREIQRLGQYLIEVCLALQLYRQGYLFYQFDTWLGKDMIVRDFSSSKEDGDGDESSPSSAPVAP